jgi:hypothetical protein
MIPMSTSGDNTIQSVMQPQDEVVKGLDKYFNTSKHCDFYVKTFT